MNQPVLERGATPAWQVFLVFLRLGLTSFGGPVAHLAYFRTEFVLRRQWLAESAYADLVALCQFLPGPASSQTGMAIGMLRAGYPGALAAWAGFTLPSALLLVLFALSVTAAGNPLPAGLLHGLKLATVAVVAQAVWGMARSLCTDAPRIAIAVVAAGAALAWQQPLLQIAVIATAALAAPLIIQAPPASAGVELPVAVTRRAGVSAPLLLLLFFVLLAGLPLLAASWPQPELVVGAAFYRAGALVFGGGHVVLPLLQTAVVPTGWVDENTFLAGYGVTQAMPGPLFAFAAFLGAALPGAIGGWSGALLCLAAIFLPSFLLLAGALPFWEQLRGNRRARAALAGVNAAVVGLLFTALCHPVSSGAIHDSADALLAVAALAALMRWKLPPWLVVLACALAGVLLA